MAGGEGPPEGRRPAREGGSEAGAPTERDPAASYLFEGIADGVWAGFARREGTALSNTGVVDLGPTTLVFDTSLTLRSAREILAASAALTGRPPALAANSHWHLDHMLGNQLFDDHPIYATTRTVEILLEKRVELEAELEPKKLEADIRELERQRGLAATEAGRAPYDHVLRINRTLLGEAMELRFVAPTATFQEELRLPGDRPARLLTFGSGHTESDAVLSLPDDGVLFAGDLVVSANHPNLTSGDPEHWLTVLDRIEALQPERIVPGHGPAGSMETVREVRDYLSTLLKLAREPGEPPLPTRFHGWAEPDMFTANLNYVRTRAGPVT